MGDILDTMHGVGWIAQLQLAIEGTWVSWTQFTTQNGRTPTEARELARTLVQRKLEREPNKFVRGRVVRADWIVEEVLNPPATNPGSCPVRSSVSGQPCLLPAGHEAYRPDRFHQYAPRAGAEGVAKNAGLEAEVESGTRDER